MATLVRARAQYPSFQPSADIAFFSSADDHAIGAANAAQIGHFIAAFKSDDGAPFFRCDLVRLLGPEVSELLAQLVRANNRNVDFTHKARRSAVPCSVLRRALRFGDRRNINDK